MFISVRDLFKIGMGPSSSHTMGPMVAAKLFRAQVEKFVKKLAADIPLHIRCTLKGSLAYTGKGHATDKAVVLGLHGFSPGTMGESDVTALIQDLWQHDNLEIGIARKIAFSPDTDIIFDLGPALTEHPNGMIFELLDTKGSSILSQTYFSIGGGFLNTPEEIATLKAPLKMTSVSRYPYPFNSARSMLEMAEDSGLSIAEMKRTNELVDISAAALNSELDTIWHTMHTCVTRGLVAEGILSGGLNLERRAKKLHIQLQKTPNKANLNGWLCAYALAASEENAAGHMVVTAPTNGAAGVLPAVLYYAITHEGATREHVRDFLLTAGAIGGIIKHRSSISGAEVGCQGEVGSASSMAAAGLCAIKGGTPAQVEHAAEMALEHHLGMTCDPVAGLVQIPCIERNGFGAVKAYTAATLALLAEGRHFMPLDSCIAAMKQTGLEMSEKYKETSLGGLAISYTEC
jgi:L-serine dehydratase